MPARSIFTFSWLLLVSNLPKNDQFLISYHVSMYLSPCIYLPWTRLIASEPIQYMFPSNTSSIPLVPSSLPPARPAIQKTRMHHADWSKHDQPHTLPFRKSNLKAILVLFCLNFGVCSYKYSISVSFDPGGQDNNGWIWFVVRCLSRIQYSSYKLLFLNTVQVVRNFVPFISQVLSLEKWQFVIISNHELKWITTCSIQIQQPTPATARKSQASASDK